MESRVSRLHGKSAKDGGPARTPSVDYGLEIRTITLFAVLAAISGGLLAGLLFTDLVDRQSSEGLMIGFSLGLIVTCAFSSSLAFLVFLRHRLLLLAASASAIAFGATLLGWMPLEGLAKVLFATSVGLWISLMLTSIGQVMLISLLIIIVDIYSVFLGPTRKMVESGGDWIDYLTISLPVFGVPASSRLGMSDIIFFALFVGTTLIYRLRRATTAIGMTISFIATMVIGVTLDLGVPALPLLSVFFLLSNADLLYRRFLEEPDEPWKRDGR